jgi:hypothetical protein
MSTCRSLRFQRACPTSLAQDARDRGQFDPAAPGRHGDVPTWQELGYQSSGSWKGVMAPRRHHAGTDRVLGGRDAQDLRKARRFRQYRSCNE